MPISQIDLAKLYLAYVNRVPDAAVYAYWASHGTDAVAVAADLAASPEFKAAHDGKGNAALVNSLYHQLFGHAADGPGVQYWTGLLDSGALGRADLPRHLASAAEGSDKVALDSKAAAALALGNELDTAAEVAAYWTSPDAAVLLTAYLNRVTDAASLAAFKSDLPFLASTLQDWGYIAYTGQVQSTGYLQGATVFSDSNGNGKFDQGEWNAVTDSQGRYILTAFKGGIVPPSKLPLPLLVTGGTDAATGLANHGSYAATNHGQAINALSSLHQQLQQTSGLSAAQASARLADAFGLGSVDVTKTSPLYAAFDTVSATPDAVKTALHLQTVVASLDGLQLAVARTLVSLAGGTAQFSEALAYKAVAGALADSIALGSGASDLSSASFITALLAASVAQAGNASLSAAAGKLSALATQAFGQLLEAGLANIEQAASASGGLYGALAHVGQASVVLQAALADKLAVAMAASHPETLLTSFLGSALSVSTPGARIVDLDPASLNDAAALARANSGAGVPAISAIEVGKLYAALFQRPADPAGQTYWQAQSSLQGLEAALVQSSEFQQQIAGKSNAEAIDQMYINMFGHTADNAGLAYWSGLVQNGYLTLGGTAIALTQAAQGSDAVALQAKAVAAAEYTAALQLVQSGIDYVPQDKPIAAAIVWLRGVHDEATLSSAMATLPSLFKDESTPGPFPLPPIPSQAVGLVGISDAGSLLL